MKQQFRRFIHPRHTLLFLLFNVALNVYGQIYTGPIPKPTSGYGADGGYTVAIQHLSNPGFPDEDIRIYYPSGITSSVPTIFYSHGFGGSDPNNVLGLLSFVARKGYAIVFVPYQTLGVTTEQRYSTLLDGFIKAVHDFPNIIDTTKVGFMGHSFGGGATFTNAYHCFTSLSWGQSGRFIFASAQYYSFNISQTELQSFPSNTKLLTMVYENDSTNDHRMANDIFNTVNIPITEKDYLMVKSDTIDGYFYEAIHGVPNTLSSFDALDYFAIYRILDALCDYTFNGSAAGKEVALGNGSVNQVSMPGGMHNLVQTDYPNFAHPDTFYTYPCNLASNPRQEYCNEPTSVGEHRNEKTFKIFPNPSHLSLTISFPSQNFSVEIFNYSGNLIYSKTDIYQAVSIKTANFPNGLYLVRVTDADGNSWIKNFVKE